MTRILFLQDVPYDYIGVMQMSANLKKAGHECDALIWEKEKDFWTEFKEINPEVVCFSVISGWHKTSLQKAKEIKERYPEVVIVFGGTHPTYFPEVLNEEPVDVICRGEGDISIVELINNLEKGKDITKIKDLWVKKDGKIYKNELRDLVEDLDSLPFMDREIYYKRYKFLRDIPTKRFMTGRGCVANCTFCYNPTIKKMYKGKGQFVRKRSPQSMIDEIKMVKEKYPLKNVRFSDDTFATHSEWVLEFMEMYKREINLPFSILARGNELLSEDVLKALKEGGCDNIAWGIESGDEEYRKKVLHKFLNDDQIREAGKLLKKYKIKFSTYNMFGMPGETLEQAWNTIKINAQIKPDYPFSTVFQPYPATELKEYAQKTGVLDESFDVNNIGMMHDGSYNPIKLKNKNEIINLQNFFWVLVRFPKSKYLIQPLIGMKPNKLFNYVEKFSSGWVKFNLFGADIRHSLILALGLRKKL
ncbi:radical SAM protein [Candidatus Woesearchaeota archaeon]|nr:radical SAM protein [Candidatus Woesearchaeota archaeon]